MILKFEESFRWSDGIDEQHHRRSEEENSDSLPRTKRDEDEPLTTTKGSLCLKLSRLAENKFEQFDCHLDG